MNAQKSAYENAFANLAGSHKVETKEKVMGTSVNDNLELAKTFTNEIGTQLLAQGGQDAINKFTGIKGFNELNKAEKLKALAKKAKDKLQQGESTSGSASAATATATGEQQASLAAADEDGDVFEDAEEPAATESMGVGGRPQPAEAWLGEDEISPAPVAQEGEEVSSLASKTIPEVTDVESTVSTLSKIAPEVEEGLQAATEVSAAADEDPIGLGVTLALGSLTLLSGLFIHPTQPKVLQQASQRIPNNFSVQIGAN